MKRFLVAWAVLGALPAVLCAEGRTPTIKESISLKRPGGGRVSPDGKYVAYTVHEADWDDNSFRDQVWLAVPATGERYQLTRAKQSSHSPRWSPDGTRLAFLSDRTGKTQLY